MITKWQVGTHVELTVNDNNQKRVSKQAVVISCKQDQIAVSGNEWQQKTIFSK